MSRSPALLWLCVAVMIGITVGASYAFTTVPGRLLDDLDAPALVGNLDRSNVTYTLNEGATADEIGDELAALGVIRSGFQFRVLVTLMGLEDQLTADEYDLKRNSPVPDVIRILTLTGEISQTLRVTFPEGIRIEEMAVRAEEAGFGTKDEFLAAAAAAELPEDFLIDKPEGSTMQGYLFPDTYIFPVAVANMDTLVREMVATLDARFTPDLRAAVRANGLTLHEALTIASIVEREAVLAPERPLIASVFLNRIREGMRLDADPTVQFAAALDPLSVAEFGYWKQELSRLDLQNQSPYNTYVVTGIPPGPITNPGLASIEAVANPANTNYFYFVANGIKADGSHEFAETLEQHNLNDERYNR